MNILNDKDLKTYMNNKQMYVTKEICDYNFKTQFEAKTVYKITSIFIEWINDNTVMVEMLYNNEICQFTRTCTNLELYAELKHLFIPVSELWDAYKK